MKLSPLMTQIGSSVDVLNIFTVILIREPKLRNGPAIAPTVRILLARTPMTEAQSQLFRDVNPGVEVIDNASVYLLDSYDGKPTGPQSADRVAI